MSEFGGLWKHENNQHALVPLKTECGCPSGGGMKNGHIPLLWRNAEKRKKKTLIGAGPMVTIARSAANWQNPIHILKGWAATMKHIVS